MISTDKVKHSATKTDAQRIEVPLSDLRTQYQRIAPQVMEEIGEVLENASFILGPKTAAFEEEFARYCGSKHCIGVNSGTSALHLALICAGVGYGDEVITVPMTFIATSWAISYCGARPVFVDVEPGTCTIDPALVEKAITPRTKAILPVHLYGQPADMEGLMEISRRRGIPLIEDCARRMAPNIGARAWGIPVWRDASAFIRERISGRSARRARSSPTRTPWRLACGPCAIMRSGSDIITRKSDTTIAWTAFRGRFWA